MEGPNAGWIFEALENAFQKHGSPKHIISDRASVFIGDVFTDLLDQWDVKPRFGAIRQHGSISVTEINRIKPFDVKVFVTSRRWETGLRDGRDFQKLEYDRNH